MKSRDLEATLLNLYLGKRDPEKPGKRECLGSVPRGRFPRPPDGKNDLRSKYTDPRVAALTMTPRGIPGHQPSTKATNHLAKLESSQKRTQGIGLGVRKLLLFSK